MKTRALSLAGAVAVPAFLIVPSVSAQQVLEEIVVTAQKREESLQDTPVAVTALMGEDLVRAGVLDPDSLANSVPNLDSNSEPNRDGLVLVIRGVAGTDVRDSADPTTAFHVDGSYVPRLSGANAYFFDLERVEVLRGPQGTLWGRNSTSGVVNVISNKPDTEAFSVSGEAGVGNFKTTSFRGAINIPLTDNIAVRAAVLKYDHDGYRENPGLRDGDDADDLAGRFHLLWDLTDRTSLLFTAEHYSRDGVGQVLAARTVKDLDELPTSITDPFGTPLISPANTDPSILAPDPADKNPLGTQGKRDNHDNNFRLQLTHAFDDFGLGSFEFFYLGAYRTHRRDFLSDTRGAGVLLPTTSPAVASGVIASDDFLRESNVSDTWTYEVRLTSTAGGPWQWILGAFYLDEEIDSDFEVQLTRDPALNVGFNPPIPPLANGNDRISVRFTYENQTNESIAAFFNTSYDFSQSFNIPFRLHGGVRWTEDEKKSGRQPGEPEGSRQIISLRPPGGQFITIATVPQLFENTWSEVTWTVGLDWFATDELMAYGNVGKGFKSGGFNRGSQGLTPTGLLEGFAPETILAYEAGVKWDLLDGRARLNLAGFYYDYEDLQVAAIRTAPDGTRVNTTFNATNADVYGFEAEGQLLVGESGLATIAIGVLDTELGSLEVPDDLLNATPTDVSGNELPRAPSFNGTFTLVPMVFRVFNGTITPRVQVHYETSAWFSTLNRSQEERDDYTKTDLSLLYEHAGSGWYGEAHVLNIENDDVLNDSLCGEIISSGGPRADPLLGCVSSYQPARTYGIRIGFRM